MLVLKKYIILRLYKLYVLYSLGYIKMADTFKDKYLNLQAQLEEYTKKERENKTYPLENTSTTSSNNTETSQANEQVMKLRMLY